MSRVSTYIRIYVYLLTLLTCDTNNSITNLCKYYTPGPSLNVSDLVGKWMSIYIQPKIIDCIILNVKTLSESERSQYKIKFQNLSYVDWTQVHVRVETPWIVHFLLGNGSESGLLENIIVTDYYSKGAYRVRHRSADQWRLVGRRGKQVLMMRDCATRAAVLFVRAPYWPRSDDVYDLLKAFGITNVDDGRLLCKEHVNKFL